MRGKTTEYRYDLIDRITEVWDNGKQVAEYEYNPDNTIKKLYYGSLYTEYSYDTNRNLTGLKTMLGAEILADNHYLYGGNGNRIEKRQLHGTTTYTYDARNRLSAVEYPGRKEGLYDKAGNLIKDDKATYQYDAFNRTSRVETFDGNIQINRYDAEGLRHEMEENGKLVSFIFRGTEVVAEESKESKIRYIRTGELLASDAECARTYYHYASDELGSITHVVSGAAKEGGETEPPAGSILNRYEYDAWGNLTLCEETVENRFKFNGQQFDPLTRQYYLRARYYNPVIGRFTQEDTYRNDGLNLYTYCRNNPIYYVDPSGNICETAAKNIMTKFGSDGQRSATRSEQKKLAAYLRNKSRKGGDLKPNERRILNQIDNYTYLPRYENQTMPSHLTGESGNNSRQLLTGEEWYQYFKKQYGAENVQGSAYNWSQAELQSAVDSIHAAGYNGESEGKFRNYGGVNPITITVRPDGNVLLSKNNGAPNINSINKAVEIFGDNLIVVDGYGKNYSGSTVLTNDGLPVLSKHSEVRGIQTSNMLFGSLQDAKQVCSHYSCNSCASVQSAEGVMNYTGLESEMGKIIRNYSSQLY